MKREKSGGKIFLLEVSKPPGKPVFKPDSADYCINNLDILKKKLTAFITSSDIFP